MLIVGSKIKLKKKMGVFDNIGEICEVIDIMDGSVICFRFGGCHLGCMSYDEYEKYFEKVEEPIKRVWTEWSNWHLFTFTNIHGFEQKILYQYRDNGKRVLVRSDVLKASASCHDEDDFSLSKGVELAKMRLVVKYLDNQVKSIAQTM